MCCRPHLPSPSHSCSFSARSHGRAPHVRRSSLAPSPPLELAPVELTCARRLPCSSPMDASFLICVQGFPSHGRPQPHGRPRLALPPSLPQARFGMEAGHRTQHTNLTGHTLCFSPLSAAPMSSS
uniref:Uncharacterized protein n=1 Tax=Zea mays TaxID=4577 RepID=B6TM58_MAIZE|nr:hypothetical protein [Zea mays]|eukprot:NP_001144140.1 uncharacterized protein LOC100276989 [Zea mays]